MPPAQNNVVMEGVRLVFRNFQGKEGPYNSEGTKNFGVILPEEVAERMLADGWNVKRLKPSEEEQEEGAEQGPPWLPVKIGYGKGRPPMVKMITSRGATNLDEDTIDQLDWVDIKVDEQGNPMVDLIVRPYHYEVRGATGISAYLQSLYVTIEEDELQRKYAELDQQ